MLYLNRGDSNNLVLSGDIFKLQHIKGRKPNKKQNFTKNLKASEFIMKNKCFPENFTIFFDYEEKEWNHLSTLIYKTVNSDVSLTSNNFFF